MVMYDENTESDDLKEDSDLEIDNIDDTIGDHGDQKQLNLDIAPL